MANPHSSTQQVALIRWFEEIGIDDIPLVGGKNAFWGEMYRELASQGVKVPNGFAVTAEAYSLCERDVPWQGIEIIRCGESVRALSHCADGIWEERRRTMSRMVISKQKEKSKQAAMPMSRELLGEHSGASAAEITPADVHQLIAKRAYELYAEGGYRESHALDDWLEAEREALGHEHPL